MTALTRSWNRGTRLRLLAALGLALLGCAPTNSPPPTRVSEPRVAVAVAAPRRTTLHYEELGGRPFPYPLVHATVAGRPTRLIVDTGASHTVLARWLVDAAEVETQATDQLGQGHAGEIIAVEHVPDPQLAIESWGDLQGAVLAVAMPQLFQELGLGGILSPQSLGVAGGVAVVDLVAAELSWESIASNEVHSGLSRSDANLGSIDVCPVDGPTRGAVFIVGAEVGGVPSRLAIDTGANRTDVLAQTPAGRALSPASTPGDEAYTAGGKVTSRRAQDTLVQLAAVRERLDVAIVPGRASGRCARDGHLGLDVLSRCVLWLSLDAGHVACLPVQK